MGKEIERKFWVVDDARRKGAMSTFYRQGIY
jgi:CYTH domain-containing protein